MKADNHADLLANIPRELAGRPQFVVWRNEERGGKSTKVPYNARTGALASSTDPSTWSTFAEAQSALNRGEWAGIGYVFSPDDPFCGIDLDGCRDPETGEVADWALAIVNDFDSYCEISPSGSGLKIFIIGTRPDGCDNRWSISGAEPMGGKNPGVENYNEKRYFALTGQRIEGPTEPQPRQSQLEKLLAPHKKPAPPIRPKGRPPSVDRQERIRRAGLYQPKLDPSISGSGGHNAAIRAAFVFVEGFDLTPDEAWPTMCDFNARCQPPWSEYDLRRKLTEADKLASNRGYLLHAERPGLAQGNREIVRSDRANDELLGLDPVDDEPDFQGEPDGIELSAQNGHFEQRHQNDEVVHRQSDGGGDHGNRNGESKKKGAKAANRPDPSGRQNAGMMDPAEAARAIVSRSTLEGSPKLGFWRGQYLQYERGGFYRVMEKSEFRAFVTGALDKDFHHLCSKDVANVLEHLRSQTLVRSTVEPNSWLHNTSESQEQDAQDWPAVETISCANGLWRLPMIAARRGLAPEIGRDCQPINPRYFTFNALPFDVSLTAPEPSAWIEFLNQLWPTDQESIDALQKWFGYVIGGSTRLQKILLMVGPKRSGKGTIGRTLVGLVGKRNVAGPTLSSFGMNFGLWALLDKSLAIVSDARLSFRHDQAVIVERLLSISGEDPLTVDRKNLEPVTCKIPARLMIMSNELPRLGDSSGAMASRIILLRLSESFYGRENTALTDQLMAELPGIFLWAVEGWRRLQEDQQIKQPASAADMVEDMESLGSPIGAFVKERCCVRAGWSASTADLYAEWKKWCEENGRREPGTMATFGRDLFAAVPGLKKSQHRDDSGDRFRSYEGIGIVGETARASW